MTGLHCHRSHDYRFLISRWRKVARCAGLKMSPLAEESGHQVFALRSRALGPRGGLYLSAGIHGDEPASTEALVAWAEKHVASLGELPCLVFPCLNPWGLINNSRVDALGRDLNRVFHKDEPGSIHALKQAIKAHHFALALALHEDYDGQGVYIYEIERSKPFWGEALLEAARPFLPIEGRTSIDGRRATGGLLRRKIRLEKFRKMGYPESVYLHVHHARRTFTIETPSEFALHDRVSAQVAILEECVRRFASEADSAPL
jgi:predicted deacylase